jgi:hypothetical protein
MRKSVGGSDRGLYAGASAWWSYRNHERVVICAAQAENPAGLQTGQSNLPKRLGEFVLRPAEG